MAFPQMEDDELNQIIDEVGRDLDSVVASAQARLSKADEEKSSPPEKSPEASDDSGSGSDSGPPSDSGSDPSAGGPPGMDASASPSADPSAGGPPPDASASAGAPGADPAAGGEDLETKLQALPDDQLRHLYMAAKQALFARMASADPQASASAPGAPPAASPAPAGPGMSPSPSAPPMAPPAGPPAASPPPAGPPAPPMDQPPVPGMGKGEMKASPANGGGKTSAVKVGKNEGAKPNEDLMKAEDAKKIDQLSKQVENLSKALEGTLQFLTQPMRKAVTRISEVQHLGKPGQTPDPKAVTLSKAEITDKLKVVTANPSLAKKDREAVNAFYCGRVGVDKIAHLLG